MTTTRLFLIFLLLLGNCLPKKNAPPATETTQAPAVETAAENTALPVDPEVRIGHLKNGLAYYIRANQKPEKRMELRLAVNAGSLLEEEDQQGLAHFLEHMAFNGTRNFEKHELLNYIESVGMRFGADLNAYTGFDETVYMLQLPTDSEEIVAKAFLILEDWAHNITLEPEEIEKERGVVVEEWRRGRGAQARIQDKQFPVLFQGSQYAERLPIGKKEIIETAPKEAIERFYKDWYRPDLMAVVAVGDFDPDTIETLIVTHFDNLKNPENPRQRPSFPVPDHRETLFSIETDPELTQSIVQIYYKHPATSVTNVEEYRRSIVANLNESLLNQRLRERTKEENPPFVAAFSSYSSLVRSKDSFSQGAMVKENEFEEGLVGLLSEAVRAKRFGFTESELERQKKGILRGLERAYNEREKTHSSLFAGRYVSHFLNQTTITSIGQRLDLYRELLPGISLEEVNAAAKDWITEENRVITFSEPQKEGIPVPGPEDFLAVIEKVDGMEIAAYRDEVKDQPLLEELPRPGNVVSEKQREDLGLWEWSLSNGIRVVLKPTDYKNDEILFTAFSPGGSSLVSDEDYVPAITANLLVEESGLGDFGAIELEKKLTGKVVSVTPYLSETSEGFNGSMAPQDAENLFQLIYLYFTAPRAEQSALESIRTRWKAFVENRESSPDRVFSDEINQRLYQNHPRRQPTTLETLAKLDLEASLRIYKDRFADAGDFTFIFVGNLELDTMKPLVETYLGGLPATGRQETWRDVGADYAKGKIEFEIKRGMEPKSSVLLIYSGAADWNSENRYALNSLNEALRMRLREVLREDMGGVYGVSVFGSISKIPKEDFRTNIRFSCDPENVDSLVQAVDAEIEAIQQNGIDQSYVDKIKEIQNRQYEVNTKRNAYWLANLDFCYDYGLDPSNILVYPERVKGLTADTLKQAAQTYYGKQNYMRAVLNPKEMQSN